MIAYTGSTTITTTGNIDDLDFSNEAEIRMNNASDATIRGLKAGVAGQKVRIVSVGAGIVYLAHQNAGSTAANRLINFATSSTTPLAAGVGTAELEYDATTTRWRLVSHCQGDYIDVPYSSGNFVAQLAGTWTVDSGDQITFCYYLNGRKLFVIAYLDTTSIVQSGFGPNGCLVTIPNSFTTSRKMQGLSLGFDNGVATPFYNRVGVSATQIEIGRYDGGQLANSTNNTYIRAYLEFGVN